MSSFFELIVFFVIVKGVILPHRKAGKCVKYPSIKYQFSAKYISHSESSSFESVMVSYK